MEQLPAPAYQCQLCIDARGGEHLLKQDRVILAIAIPVAQNFGWPIWNACPPAKLNCLVSAIRLHVPSECANFRLVIRQTSDKPLRQGTEILIELKSVADRSQ